MTLRFFLIGALLRHSFERSFDAEMSDFIWVVLMRSTRMASIMKVLVRNLMNCWRVSSALVIGPRNKDLLNDIATCVLLAESV